MHMKRLQGNHVTAISDRILLIECSHIVNKRIFNPLN
jgi:hypothetical protein